MSRNPRVTGKRLISVLEPMGFVVSRVRGSHHFVKHPDGRNTVIPVHSGEIVGPGLLHKILRDCALSVEDLSRRF
jgi:predicted RNA binding protein YcfA (HicA-like mRNA interferase family)